MNAAAAAPGIFRHNEIKKNKDLQSANLSKGSSSLKLDSLHRQIMPLYGGKKAKSNNSVNFILLFFHHPLTHISKHINIVISCGISPFTVVFFHVRLHNCWTYIRFEGSSLNQHSLSNGPMLVAYASLFTVNIREALYI